MEPNQLLDVAAFKKLEKMPTKQALMATVARLLNQVTVLRLPLAYVPAHCSFLVCVSVGISCLLWAELLAICLSLDCV